MVGKTSFTNVALEIFLVLFKLKPTAFILSISDIKNNSIKSATVYHFNFEEACMLLAQPNYSMLKT